MTQPSHQRQVQLIAPRFQLKIVGIFLGLSCLFLVVPLLLLGVELRLIANAMPPGNLLAEEVGGLVSRAIIYAVGMGLPISLGIGILVTHKIAGPVFRLERHLEAVARGEEPGECRLRKKDEFQNLARLVNAALATVQGAPEGAQTPRSGTDDDAEPLRRAG